MRQETMDHLRNSHFNWHFIPFIKKTNCFCFTNEETVHLQRAPKTTIDIPTGEWHIYFVEVKTKLIHSAMYFVLSTTKNLNKIFCPQMYHFLKKHKNKTNSSTNEHN